MTTGNLLLAGGGVILAVVGVAVVARKRGTTGSSSSWKPNDPAFEKGLVTAAGKMSSTVMASAKKWASARGLPLSDVLATILLESRGNPKAHALTAREDSRGLMQVNVNAHKGTLTSKGYSPDDLYDIDKGVEVGTAILKSYRGTVESLVAASKVKQAHDLSTLTRLRYAGPAYVDKMLRTATKTEDTAHVFKDSEKYVDHWLTAKAVVRRQWPEVA